MVKNKIDMKIIGVILLILGGIFYVFQSSRGNDEFLPEMKNKDKIVCDISIRNPIISRTRVVSHVCSKQGKCGIFSFSTYGMNILNDRGFIKITTGDEVKTRPFKLGELGSNTYSMSICSDHNSGKIQIISDDGVISDEVEFVV